VRVRHLLDDPFYLRVRAGHRVASKARVRLADLAAESWIMGTTGRCPDGRVLERACQGAGFEPRLAFQSDDYVASLVRDVPARRRLTDARP
jgi:DNA-binding transcriptional LysR family regulator